MQSLPMTSLWRRESKCSMLTREKSLSIKEHLLHQKQHEDKLCKCTFVSLTKVISGVGGTGKSFLIEAIIWQSEDLKCAITAPTGLAAFNVGGVTIHRLFQLPIEHEGKEAGYWALPKAAQKVMKSTLRSLKVPIIDEVSMVSSLKLVYIHLRMSELFGSDTWFGGMNVLLWAICSSSMEIQYLRQCTKRQYVTSWVVQLLSTFGAALWSTTINERQKKDGGFSTILDSVRRGNLTDKITATLQDRVSSFPSLRSLLSFRLWNDSSLPVSY